MRENMGTAFCLVSVVFCLVAAPSGIGSPQTSDVTNQQIEVRISPKAKVIRVGEPLEVRVEIKNVGRGQLFIEKEIYDLCAYSPLSLSLELGPPLKAGEGHACAACLDDPKMDFASRLAHRWISLPAGNFYGTTLRMDPDTFPQLQTPGRWRLRGKYRSGGDLSSSHCLNQIVLDPEQTGKLPDKAWKGEESSNVVWIEVQEPNRSAKKK